MTTEQHKAKLICEIYEARYLQALKTGTDEDVAAAEKRFIKASWKVQDLYGVRR